MNPEKLKQWLEQQGLEPEKIQNFLAQIEKDHLEEQKYLENMLSVNDAAVYLNEKLEDKWNSAKVRRFILDGEIQPSVNPGNAKKMGYKIHKDELDRFIYDYSMTKEDWKAYAKKLEKKVAALETNALLSMVPISNVDQDPTEEEVVITGLKVTKVVEIEEGIFRFDVEFKYDDEMWYGFGDEITEEDRLVLYSMETKTSSSKRIYYTAHDEWIVKKIMNALLQKGLKYRIAKMIEEVSSGETQEKDRMESDKKPPVLETRSKTTTTHTLEKYEAPILEEQKEPQPPFPSLIKYMIDKDIPCPLCGKWKNYSKFAKHAKEGHRTTAKQILNEQRDIMDKMWNERKNENSSHGKPKGGGLE
ncbi:hypothetical protein HPT25_22635 [Bacillus sp. BRMEA1]|uniref:hypothetical protein n=1 Tax=Neobacillus endophyticus TaxID=2738405 RepID=UPI00156498E7|nr:hypothetical protein [Neobacillus endophyticus]NRD80139.1 hypothetical protein [Neobacillus endophyticus]